MQLDVPLDRCEWHLFNWAAWMRGSGNFLRLPSRASGGMGNSGSSDLESMASQADARCAVAVDAIISDMPRLLQAVVYHIHLGSMQPVCDLTVGYEQVKKRVNDGLRIRGIY